MGRITLEDGKIYRSNNNNYFYYKNNKKIPINNINGYYYTKDTNKLIGRPAVSKRIRENTTRTSKGDYNTGAKWKNTTEVEDTINGYIRSSKPNFKYGIPFIEDKAIKINSSYISTNALDSIAKYAGQAQIPIEEALGLLHESFNGSVPFENTAGAYNNTSYGKKHPLTKEQGKIRDRVLLNANYFRNYGFIPSENIVRDFKYSDDNINTNIPPLLHAMDIVNRKTNSNKAFYNPGDSNYEDNNTNYGKRIYNNEEVKKWWNDSGRYFYNMPTTATNRKSLEYFEKRYGKIAKRKNRLK